MLDLPGGFAAGGKDFVYPRRALVSGPASAPMLPWAGRNSAFILKQRDRTIVSEAVGLVGNHPKHFCGIGIADQRAFAQVAFPLSRLGGKDVTLKSFGAFHLARGGLFKALGCSLVGFHFRHKIKKNSMFPFVFRLPIPPQIDAVAVVAAVAAAGPLAAAAAFLSSCYRRHRHRR